MLVRLSCLAILIAVACASETKILDKLKKESTTENAVKTETVKERSKRALYYQNDLISNQERQMRKLYPFGNIPAYDYSSLYALPLLYDYPLYDYLLADPLLADPLLYPMYGAGVGLGGVGVVGGDLAAAGPIAEANANAVRTVVDPALASPVPDYDDDSLVDDFPPVVQPRRGAIRAGRGRSIPLDAKERPVNSGEGIVKLNAARGFGGQQFSGFAPKFGGPQFGQQFNPSFNLPQQTRQQFQGQTWGPQGVKFNQQQQNALPFEDTSFSSAQRSGLDAIRAAYKKGNEMNAKNIINP